jgi:hypothetical protein
LADRAAKRAGSAREMRRVIEAARADGHEVHVAHLGDTYYSGWGEENGFEAYAGGSDAQSTSPAARQKDAATSSVAEATVCRLSGAA